MGGDIAVLAFKVKGILLRSIQTSELFPVWTAKDHPNHGSVDVITNDIMVILNPKP